jgi:YidC/Oxa1 family membrane protein insertase
MSLIDQTFGVFFGFLLRACYQVTGDFAWAILIFTLLTKALLFPISLLSQKNSIVLVKLKPQLADLQARYEGELETLLKEQKALYKKENYSTLKALLPLLVQIPLIVGVISAINNPVRHIGAEIRHMLWGSDLFAVPDSLLVPVLAIASTAFLCVMQNIYNVISREQGFFGKWGVTIFLVIFTGWFVFVCPAGVGLYWTYSNLFGVVVLALCNMFYSPKRYIDYENRSVRPKLTKEEKIAKKEKRQQEKAQESLDMKRFFATKKELVF